MKGACVVLARGHAAEVLLRVRCAGFHLLREKKGAYVNYFDPKYKIIKQMSRVLYRNIF
jgi:hypothetical protein